MAEQVEPQHGFGCAPLVGDEPDEEGDAADERHKDRWAGPPVVRLLDEAEHDSAESEGAQRGAGEVDLPMLLARARGDGRKDHQQRDRDKRHVEREDPAPREAV